MSAVYGAIEAGGTKFVCAVAESPGPDLVTKQIIPTTTPDQTLAKAVEFFRGRSLRGLGIACFGPLDLERGRIGATPKTGWVGVDVVRAFREALGVPIRFDTDVNGAALGEARHGAGKCMDPLIYVTVGTGIGTGVLVSGRPVHGMMHPEAGHLFVKRRADDAFHGSCPFHADCLEGMASGPAIEARWGSPGSALPADHPAWELEAHYLAQAMCDLIYVVSPQRIVLGGGVMNHQGLLGLIRQETRALLAGYVQTLADPMMLDEQIVPAALGDDAGIVGALELAFEAAQASSLTGPPPV